MNVIVQVLQTLVFLFVLFLLGRVVLSWVTMLARDWRPSGASLFVVEAIYTPTADGAELLFATVRHAEGCAEVD